MEQLPLDESALVEAARTGDAAAYAQLVRRYQDLAFRVAYLNTRHEADAADAAQEAFVKAYYALPRFREDAPFRPWLLRIVANEARNRRRAAGRRERLALRAAVAPDAAAEGTPEDDALLTERRETLLAALAKLWQKDRQVIEYRYFLDLSETEMAEVMGVRPGTVKSRLSRALAKLRPLLAEIEGADR